MRVWAPGSASRTSRRVPGRRAVFLEGTVAADPGDGARDGQAMGHLVCGPRLERGILSGGQVSVIGC